MKIVVLAGGISTERDVSLSSGTMVYRALKKKGHQVIILDVYLGLNTFPQDLFTQEKDWAAAIGAISEKNPDINEIKALRSDGDKNFFGPNVIAICQQADVVFMALHGENGENGKIQAAFDLLGITYTGTDYVSSALAMDKGIAKELFAYHDIPTPSGVRLKKEEVQQHKAELPCVLKVCCGGSSVGVSIARTEAEFQNALSEVLPYGDEFLIESYIEGREFSVGVLDGKALPVIEIAPLQGFYDYKNKYQAGSTLETCPAQISDEKSVEMQKISEKVFQILRLKNYARMDFMMDRAENVYCLEANTLPGMTPTSLLPQEAKAVGMEFEDLCQKIIDISLQGSVRNQ